jgi:hypothetical protein
VNSNNKLGFWIFILAAAGALGYLGYGFFKDLRTEVGKQAGEIQAGELKGEPSEWKEFSVPLTPYFVTFPLPPQDLTKKDGGYTFPFYRTEWEKRIFMLTVYPLGNVTLTPEQLLDESVKMSVRNLKNAKLIGKKPLRYSRFPGIEYHAEAPPVLGVPMHLIGRIYMMEAHVIELSVLSPVSNPGKDAAILSFLESFRTQNESRKTLPVFKPGAVTASETGAAFESKAAGPVRTFQLKNGQIIEGKVLQEDPIYYTIETAAGTQQIVIKEDLAA